MKFQKIIAMILLSAAMMGLCLSCASGNNVTEQSTKKSGDADPDNTGDGATNRDTSAEADKTGPDVEPAWKKDKVLRILTIGNSFSDDTMQYVYQIASSAGVEKIELGNLYIGGCTLATHVSNAKEDKGAYEYRQNSRGVWSTTANYKMSKALASKEWDFISMQQASGSSGLEVTYKDLDYLIKYVRERANPDAVLVWNMTWAYQQDSTHSEFPRYGSDQKKMYESILSAVSKKVDTKSEIKIISPTGTAIQNARTSYIGDNLTRDGYHLTYGLGRYTAGLTFFHALTGLPIDNVGYAPDGIEEEEKKIAIESAVNAVKNPRQITQSAYTKAPEQPVFNENDYTKLVINWTPLGYWNSTDGSRPHTVITNANNSKQFYASPLFTKEDIPVGSVIVIASGWQYRPEAWKNQKSYGQRPDNVTTERVTVTEKWWGEYTERAFNLSKKGLPALTGDLSEIDGVFTVYIPKK